MTGQNKVVCAPCKGSYQPGQLLSLIRIFAVHLEGSLQSKVCPCLALESSHKFQFNLLSLWESTLKERICFFGPGCSKLTMSQVNISLKFQTSVSNIRQYFLLKKCKKIMQCKSFSHFSTKNISVFGYKVIKHLRS